VPVAVPDSVPECGSDMVTVVLDVVELKDIVMVYVVEVLGAEVVECKGAEVEHIAVFVSVEVDVSVLVTVYRCQRDLKIDFRSRTMLVEVMSPVVMPMQRHALE